MHVRSSPFAALVHLGLLLGASASPAPDHALQQLMQVPPRNRQDVFGSPPFTPGHQDPFDHKVDSVGEGREPLPFRNGDGATVQGPRNKDRERQNPDLVRPPSTDHGSMSNMRWSFSDSHTRIEVVFSSQLSGIGLFGQPMTDQSLRKADGRARRRSASCPQAVS